MVLTIINTVVGIIGIIVGVIGWKSLSTAIKIKNEIKANTVQQAQIINNGMDSFAVIKLTEETTKQELVKIIEEIQLKMDKKIEDSKVEIVRLI